MQLGQKMLVVHVPDIGGSKLDGQEVWIHGFYTTNHYQDYVKVLTKTGEVVVLHKSQLKET